MNCLDVARRDCEWELADLCLERYRGVVQAVMDSLASSSSESNSNPEIHPNPADCLNDGIQYYDGAGSGAELFADVNLQLEWFDEPWESFWLNDLFPSSN
jgi:hypothetical protein